VPEDGYDNFNTFFKDLHPKNLKDKNVQKLAQFWTHLKFDHKYLWNGSRYPQAENSIINYNHLPRSTK